MKRHNRIQSGFLIAVLSAIFFSLNIPVSKWLLGFISPYWLASFLYFGAGLGTLIYQMLGPKTNVKHAVIVRQKEWFVLMIGLDILAPLMFFIGVQQVDGAVVGLLSNTEFIFTLLFALILFKEIIPGHLWFAFILILIGVSIANLDEVQLTFNLNQLWIILAMVLWGLENNVSKTLSLGNPLHVVIVKGLGTGLGSLVVSLIAQEPIPNGQWILISLALGFLIYGRSLIAYVIAQRKMGAALVQMVQSFAPILGGIMTAVIFVEPLGLGRMIGYGVVIIALVMIGIISLKIRPNQRAVSIKSSPNH
jgi:drug/metabolite transporter (DMT)-like permease